MGRTKRSHSIEEVRVRTREFAGAFAKPFYSLCRNPFCKRQLVDNTSRFCNGCQKDPDIEVKVEKYFAMKELKRRAEVETEERKTKETYEQYGAWG